MKLKPASLNDPQLRSIPSRKPVMSKKVKFAVLSHAGIFILQTRNVTQYRSRRTTQRLQLKYIVHCTQSTGSSINSRPLLLSTISTNQQQSTYAPGPWRPDAIMRIIIAAQLARTCLFGGLVLGGPTPNPVKLRPFAVVALWHDGIN